MVLRNGMWVRTETGVGIYLVERVGVKADGSRRLLGSAAPAEDERLDRDAWVHVVNADGTTLAQVPADVFPTITQAAWQDIPESRRPSQEVGARLGYV